MRNVLPICAGLVGISVIVSATMWNELRNERQVVAELRTQLAESSDQLAASRAAQRGAIPQATVAASSTAPAAMQPDAPAAPPVPAAQPANADLLRQAARTREQELMADPEYRNARIAQQRLMMGRNYPGLAEELGLSQKEADQLFNLLTENQMNMSNELSGRTSSAAQDPAARAEIQRRLQELQRQQEDQVAALLGSRYPQWQAYRETQGSRQQAMQYATQLAQAGQPLTDVQQRGLTSVLIAEQKRLQLEIVPMARSANAADPQTRLQLEEQAMRMQEESRNRTLDSAAAHLSARQIASLRQQFETEAAMTAAQRRIMQRQQALTEQVAVPVPAPQPR